MLKEYYIMLNVYVEAHDDEEATMIAISIREAMEGNTTHPYKVRVDTACVEEA